MVNVLMLSKWHVHAEGYAKFINNQPDAKVSCVWDEDPARGKEWADSLGVPFEADLDAALARNDVDAVAVCAPTSDHPKVMIAAARAKKHIFTEKTMALTTAECEQIAAEVNKAGVKFSISHPQLTTPAVIFTKKLIEEGAIGRVHYARFRSAHQGSSAGWLPDYWYDKAKAGGGAMMDLGCHPMYTAAYLLGKPARIVSMFNNSFAPRGLDDNDVSVIEFENKAIAVCETSFVSPYNAETFEVLGLEGAVAQVDGRLRVRDKNHTDGWYIPDHDKLPKPMPEAIRVWLDAIQHGTEIPFSLQSGYNLAQLLEQAYVSDETQKIVKF